MLTGEIAVEVTGVVGVSPALWYFRYIASIFLTLHKRLCLELAIVLTDDSINVKGKRIIHCKLYTVKSAQVIPFRPRLFK
jgi:hypothetical protein